MPAHSELFGCTQFRIRCTVVNIGSECYGWLASDIRRPPRTVEARTYLIDSLSSYALGLYIIIRRLEIWNASSAAHMCVCVWWRESPHRPTSYSSTPFSSLYSVLMESLAFDASKDIHHSEMTKGAAAKGFASWWKSQRDRHTFVFTFFLPPLFKLTIRKLTERNSQLNIQSPIIPN